MSFWDWLAKRPEEQNDSQLDLFGEQTELLQRQRIDGTIAQKHLTNAIKDQGGTGRVYAQVNGAIIEETFDCSPDELYERTQSKKNDRGTLPQTAQEALIVADVMAAFDIENADVQGKPHERNQQIIDTAAKSARQTRKRFPW